MGGIKTHATSMFFTFLEIETTIKTSNQKFMIPDHTHMECGTIHSVIERRKKNLDITISIPNDWH